MKRYIWILVGLFALALLLGGAWFGYAGGGRYPSWGMMGGPGMMGGYGFPAMGWAGGLVMLLFWGLVIAGVVWLVWSVTRGSGQSNLGSHSSESPLDVLKRRYAGGEITKGQFDEMKRNLDA